MLVSTIGVSIVPSSSTCVDPASLPKALPTNTAPATLSWNTLPAVRHDRRDAGADASPLDDRRVPDAHAGDVGDRIERARRVDAWRDAEIARPRLRLSDCAGRTRRPQTPRAALSLMPAVLPSCADSRSSRSMISSCREASALGFFAEKQIAAAGIDHRAVDLVERCRIPACARPPAAR